MTTAAERRRGRARGDADIASVARLIGDPARAEMLLALLDAESRSISELASFAGVTLPTASAHVRALREAAFVEVSACGRTRRVRLHRAEVAEALEALARIAPVRAASTLRGNERRAALHAARLCYDHLAGALGVELFASLVASGAIEAPAQGLPARHVHGGLGDLVLGPNARDVFARLQIDTGRLSPTRRFATGCLDWTHNRPHLAGALGAELTSLFFRRGWIERAPEPRIVRITHAGRPAIDELLNELSLSA